MTSTPDRIMCADGQADGRVKRLMPYPLTGTRARIKQVAGVWAIYASLSPCTGLSSGIREAFIFKGDGGAGILGESPSVQIAH